MAAPLLDDAVREWRQAEAPQTPPRRPVEPSGEPALTAAVESLRAAAHAQDVRVAARSRMRDHQQLMQAGRTAEAAEAASGAEALSHPVQTPDVELALAARAASRGDECEAERRYYGVLLHSSGHATSMGATAAYRLAHLRLGKGARDEAIKLFRRALAGADENLRAHVLVELADCLRGHVAAEEVEELYGQAVATDHPDLAPRAALTLGGLREAAGDRDGALTLYTAAVASEHPDYASDAAARHSALLRRETVDAVKQLVLTRERASPGTALAPRTGHEEPVARRRAAEPVKGISWALHLYVSVEPECFSWSDEPLPDVASEILLCAYTTGREAKGEATRPQAAVHPLPCELAERDNNHLLVSHVTYVLASLRTREALTTGELLNSAGGHWSDVLDTRHPGLLAWQAMHEAPAGCRCDGAICGDPRAQR